MAVKARGNSLPKSEHIRFICYSKLESENASGVAVTRFLSSRFAGSLHSEWCVGSIYRDSKASEARKKCLAIP